MKRQDTNGGVVEGGDAVRKTGKEGDISNCILDRQQLLSKGESDGLLYKRNNRAKCKT